MMWMILSSHLKYVYKCRDTVIDTMKSKKIVIRVYIEFEDKKYNYGGYVVLNQNEDINDEVIKDLIEGCESSLQDKREEIIEKLK